MKNIFKCCALLIVLIVASCEEHQHEVDVEDSIKPEKVENVIVTPINGGFDISYDLPKDIDLYYVKAVYTTTLGEQGEVKVSNYDNKIQILGFGDVDPKTVSLYAVDRSENVSDPVSFTESPLIDPVTLIQESLEFSAGFGGVDIVWDNEFESAVSIDFLTTDEVEDLEIIETHYTNLKSDSFSLFGFESEPRIFAAIIKDRYGNISDYIYPNTSDKTLTPFESVELDKDLFKKVILEGKNADVSWDAWEGKYENLIDDDIFTNAISRNKGKPGSPSTLTVDLGVDVQLNKVIIFQRATGISSENRGFSYGNPRKYRMWGAKTLPDPDGDGKIDGDFDNWILLKDATSIKPSGFEDGALSADDEAILVQGDVFPFRVDELIEIRYFRLEVYETWGGEDWTNIAELAFFGVIN